MYINLQSIAPQGTDMLEKSYIHNLLNNNMNITTSVSRLKEIDSKVYNTPKAHLQRWCTGGACACMGCANFLFKSKKEWLDYSAWINANKPNSVDEITFAHNAEIPFKLKNHQSTNHPKPEKE